MFLCYSGTWRPSVERLVLLVTLCRQFIMFVGGQPFDHIIDGINVVTITEHFVVQVRGDGATGTSYARNRIAFVDACSVTNGDVFEMRVARNQTVAVVDLQIMSVACR